MSSLMPVLGTTRTISDVRSSVTIRGEADIG